MRNQRNLFAPDVVQSYVKGHITWMEMFTKEKCTPQYSSFSFMTTFRVLSKGRMKNEPRKIKVQIDPHGLLLPLLRNHKVYKPEPLHKMRHRVQTKGRRNMTWHINPNALKKNVKNFRNCSECRWLHLNESCWFEPGCRFSDFSSKDEEKDDE